MKHEKGKGIERKARVRGRGLMYWRNHEEILIGMLLPIVLASAIGLSRVQAQQTGTTRSAQWDSYLPSGEGKELVKALCTNCHDLGRIVQKRKDRKQWQQTATGHLTMWDAQYVESSGKDVEILTKYLAEYLGPLTPTYDALQNDAKLREKYLQGGIKSLINVNTASADELVKVPGITKTAVATIMKHRKDQGSFRSAKELKAILGLNDTDFEKIENLATFD